MSKWKTGDREIQKDDLEGSTGIYLPDSTKQKEKFVT
jgi:hypothetical protein